MKDTDKTQEEQESHKKRHNYKKMYEEEKAKAEGYVDTLKRLQADFENFKKRNDKENLEFKKFAIEQVITTLLPVLDSFQEGIKKSSKEVSEGLTLVYNQLSTILKGYGLKEIETKDKKFDHNLHEVLLQEESDKEDNLILEEIQKGYTLNHRIIRHAKVKIAKHKEDKNEL